jgi:hypothetical protein
MVALLVLAFPLGKPSVWSVLLNSAIISNGSTACTIALNDAIAHRFWLNLAKITTA